jgi:hypothetical protein
LLSTVVCVFLHLKCDFQSPYILDSCFPSSLLPSSARVPSPGPHLPEAACAADFGHTKRNDNNRKVYTLVMTSWWCGTLPATIGNCYPLFRAYSSEQVERCKPNPIPLPLFSRTPDFLLIPNILTIFAVNNAFLL